MCRNIVVMIDRLYRLLHLVNIQNIIDVVLFCSWQIILCTCISIILKVMPAGSLAFKVGANPSPKGCKLEQTKINCFYPFSVLFIVNCRCPLSAHPHPNLCFH